MEIQNSKRMSHPRTVSYINYASAKKSQALAETVGASDGIEQNHGEEGVE